MKIYLGRRAVDNLYHLSSIKKLWDYKFGFCFDNIPIKNPGIRLKPGEMIEVDVKLKRKY